MANGDKLIERSIKVHPVFILGVGVGLVAFGSLLGATLFATAAASLGTSVLVLSVEWLVISLITIIIGLWRSFEVIGNAR